MTTDLERYLGSDDELAAGIDALPVVDAVVRERPSWEEGIQIVVRFKNGYGASVISGYGAYGPVEAAILSFGPDDGLTNYSLDYTTPIADDVIGHISSVETLLDLLKQISELEAK